MATTRFRKRFIAFLVCAVMLFAGLFVAGDNFGGFSQMLVALYTLYLGGQTATDWKGKAVAAPPG